ncbi:MAG: hypothetical protein LAE24_02535 [Candidatus Contendobacter sp.]|nr:hypothetical protein [Candidatus Contendobacter sp.]
MILKVLSPHSDIESNKVPGKTGDFHSLYKWKRVGDILSPATATQAGAAVSNAYEIAKTGGRHYGTYERFKDAREKEIEKSIRALEQRIIEHEDKIKNPEKYVEPDIKSIHLNDLVSRYWPKEIADFRAKIAVFQGILKERQNG